MLKLKAYAKVNISLDIVGKRADGYHLLEMIMQTVDIFDELEFEKCDEGIHITCDKDFVPVDRRKRTVALIDFRSYSEKVKVTAFCFTGKKNPNTGGVKEWKVFG